MAQSIERLVMTGEIGASSHLCSTKARVLFFSGLAMSALLLTVSVPLSAQEHKVLAIMPIEDQSRRHDKRSIRSATEILRGLLAQSARFAVVDSFRQEDVRRSVYKKLKRRSYEPCYDNKCRIELGQALSADSVLYCSIVSLSKTCTLKCELVPLEKEVAEDASLASFRCGSDGLEEALHSVSRQLTGEATESAISEHVRVVPSHVEYFYVSVKSTPPGAFVQIDHEPVSGVTPVSVTVAAGSHVLRLSGLEGFKAHESKLEVMQDVELSISLEVQTANLTIIPLARDGHVIEDAEWKFGPFPVGRGRKTLGDVQIGRHMLHASAKGYKDAFLEVVVVAGEDQKVEITLEKEKARARWREQGKALLVVNHAVLKHGDQELSNIPVEAYVTGGIPAVSVARIELAPGKHEFTIRCDLASPRKKTFEVTVSAGQTVDFAPVLEADVSSDRIKKLLAERGARHSTPRPPRPREHRQSKSGERTWVERAMNDTFRIHFVVDSLFIGDGMSSTGYESVGSEDKSVELFGSSAQMLVATEFMSRQWALRVGLGLGLVGSGGGEEEESQCYPEASAAAGGLLVQLAARRRWPLGGNTVMLEAEYQVSAAFGVDGVAWFNHGRLIFSPHRFLGLTLDLVHDRGYGATVSNESASDCPSVDLHWTGLGFGVIGGGPKERGRGSWTFDGKVNLAFLWGIAGSEGFGFLFSFGLGALHTK